MEKKIYPPIETTLVLSEDEMNNTLGGQGCKSVGCRNGCLEARKEGNKGGVGSPFETQIQ